MQPDCSERLPLLEIKPVSAHFRWLNLTRSLLEVIARSQETSTSHHIQPVRSVAQQNSVSIDCI